MKIPPGIKNGTRMRLAGHGLPSMKGAKRGDLYRPPAHPDSQDTSPQSRRNWLKKLAETGL
ncbi:MAG: hypothetical protein MZV70_13155 [Desulfobacterales bacterium]|nr:hypothetical protein [Desulfobacterales bacterium]